MVPVWMSLLKDDELKALRVCLSVAYMGHPLQPDLVGTVECLLGWMWDEERTRQRVCEGLAGPPRPWLP